MFLAATLPLTALTALTVLPATAAGAIAAPTPHLPVVEAGSRGLTITFSVVPSRAAAGATVQFNLNLAARAANGALGYMVRFGDGSSHANAIPMYCLAGPADPSTNRGG